jgi:hypothetical protein
MLLDAVTHYLAISRFFVASMRVDLDFCEPSIDRSVLDTFRRTNNAAQFFSAKKSALGVSLDVSECERLRHAATESCQACYAFTH